MDGVSDAVDHQMDQLLGDENAAKNRYFRFEMELANVNDDFDDASAISGN